MVQTPIDDRVILFRLLVLLGIRMRSQMDRRLADDGVTTQQAAVLTLAQGRDPAPTLTEAAEALGTSHQNVRQIVAALVRKGLLTVVTDDADRRLRRLEPTPAVDQLFATRNADDHAAVAEWSRALDDDEVRTLVRLLGRLARESAPDLVAPAAHVP